MTRKIKNSLQRARVQRDAYLNKFCGFQSLITSCRLKQWNVKWLTELRISTYIPILGVIKKEISILLAELQQKKKTKLTFEHARQIRRAIVKSVRSRKGKKSRSAVEVFCFDISMISVRSFNYVLNPNVTWNIFLVNTNTLLRCWCRHRMSVWKKTLTQASIYKFDAKSWQAQQRHKATNDTSWLPCGATCEQPVS